MFCCKRNTFVIGWCSFESDHDSCIGFETDTWEMALLKQSSDLGVIAKPLCSWIILCFENKGNQIIIIFVNFTVQ